MKVSLCKAVYNKTVVLKTANQFLDIAYLHISQTESDWIIDWICKESDESVTIESFENEAIRQQLRYEMLQTSSELRKVILARAYASTVIPNSESEVLLQERDNQPLYDTGISKVGRQSILNDWYEEHEDNHI